MKNTEKTMDKIVNLCKGRGFVFPGSEIYGGLANTWDYGPLGVELKNNIKRAWWKKFVQENPYNVGLDAAILMNPQTWVASGHLAGFSDPLMDCQRVPRALPRRQAYRGLVRRDGLYAAQAHRRLLSGRDEGIRGGAQPALPHLRQAQLDGHPPVQPDVQDLPGRHRGREERPCTCGLRRRRASSPTLSTSSAPPAANCPSASARSASPSATRSPRATSSSASASSSRWSWSSSASRAPIWSGSSTGAASATSGCCAIGLKDENLRLRDHDPEELCFYSKATTDFEFLFPFGWGELWGVADRTDYDLTQHQNTSGKDLTYFDQEKNEHYIPYVIEPSLGVERCRTGRAVRRLRRGGRGRGEERRAHRPAPASGSGSLQGAPCCPCPRSWPTRRRELQAELSQVLHGGLRRRRLHRQALPPSGRDRHALLRHRGLPDRGHRHGRGGSLPSPFATATPWSRSACLSPS